MKSKTYVSESLKNGRIMRWTVMPLKVFIAPMKFYSKQGEDYKYKQMVKQALDEWQRVSNGKISFKIVDALLSSNVNIEWKRVERKALGHCNFHYDGAQRLYGAEVSIGLTDGRVHGEYGTEDEVYHTILHEIGHALGLGHSPHKTDIMYTPHQKGVRNLSQGDKDTLNWLYTFPQGATTAEIASSYGVGGSDLDQVVYRIMNKEVKSEFEKVKEAVKIPERDLLEEAESIGNLRKYHMALQNIKINDDMRKFFLNNHPKR